MFLLNGEKKHCIEFSDRGFQYGDGLFETIEIINGKPLFFKQHIQRLLKGCQKLLIPPPDLEIITKEAFQFSHESSHAVLKLIVTRGAGGRGYRQPDSISPTRLFSLHSFPKHPESYKCQGVNVRFCSNTLGINPILAGIKHMNRLEQIIARAEWNTSDFQEGLMMDIHGCVIEGTMSNLFIVKDNILYTPLIDQCGVEGILRNILIVTAKKNKIKVIEKVITKKEIVNADELFMTNSIIGIWPIKQLEKQQFNVGILTTKLQHLFLQCRQREIESVC
ncbi:MAG: aminodeoxychorismate lyase [Methylococcaceae bacterium]|nr:aminodeoxychorismate lyase [Methylococcaceae bacterium]